MFFSFQAIAPTVPKYKPSSDSDPQQMSFHNKPPLGDSGPYDKIDSPRGIEETVSTCLLLIISIVVM